MTFDQQDSTDVVHTLRCFQLHHMFRQELQRPKFLAPILQDAESGLMPLTVPVSTVLCSTSTDGTPLLHQLREPLDIITTCRLHSACIQRFVNSHQGLRKDCSALKPVCSQTAEVPWDCFQVSLGQVSAPTMLLEKTGGFTRGTNCNWTEVRIVCSKHAEVLSKKKGS